VYKVAPHGLGEDRFAFFAALRQPGVILRCLGVIGDERPQADPGSICVPAKSREIGARMKAADEA
jgi:hypothetical protein